MPTCNKINCAIVLPPTDTPLPEYRRKYLDSSVSVYVPVPDIPILHAAPSFNIQLWTDGYIAPGLAMFVYIDGQYQCNRSKRMPSPGSAGGGSVGMRVRQKEEKVAGGEGDFVGREWRWVHLDVEQANEAKNPSRDAQDCIGKIEVVVLRCDDDGVPPVEPRTRAQAPPPAAKASEKAPLAKGPSVKAPSAASEGFGGIFGLFDGAREFGLDGTSDDTSSESWANMKHENCAGGAHESDFDDDSGLFTTSSPHEPERCLIPLGLDGQEYERVPGGVTVNQYGQLYDPRVPYYHTSRGRRPRQADDSVYTDARVGYVRNEAVRTQPPDRIEPQVGYVTAAAPSNLPPSFVQVPRHPAAHNPKVITGTDGRQYHEVEAVEQRRSSALLPQSPPPTAPEVVRYAVPARTGATRKMAPEHDQMSYIDPRDGFKYVSTEEQARYNSALQYQYQRFRTHAQPRSHHVQHLEKIAEQDLLEPPIIDPEYQRFLIFQIPEKVEALLEVDHRFVAEAVPYMPQLRMVPFGELSFEAMQKLKNNLHRILDLGNWPNGDRIMAFERPRHHETRFRRHSSPPRRASSGHKHAERYSKWNDNSEDVDWMRKHSKVGSRHGDRPDRDRPKDRRSSSSSIEHFPDSKKSQSGSHKSRNTTQSTTPWGDNGGGDAQGVEATGDWANQNNNGDNQDNQPGPGWGAQNDNQENAPAANAFWNNAPQEQTKPSDPWPTPQAVDGAGPGNHNHHAPSSHSSQSSMSTNPHAYVQPYFQTRRGNGQTPATKPLPRQHREPYAYLAPPTPYIAANQVGNRSHGVRAGKGADYTHKVRSPKYMDTMDDPYAIFVFNYRSAEKLEEILHQDVKSDLKLIAEEVGRGVLMNMPREKLVEELLKTQAKAPGVTFADAPKSANRAESRAKSNKSASRGHQAVQNWVVAVPQQAATKDDGWRPEPTGGSAKGGNAAVDSGWDTTPKNAAPANDGWAQAGEGATAQVKW